MRQRAGLVEGDALHAAGPFQMRAALDEDALPGGPGQRRDNRHRRRNDERTRARDDEQHQRAIHPRVPAQMKHERRQHGDAGGQRHDRRRVHARKPLDDRLRRRALRLRALHQMNDARKRRIAVDAGDAHLEGAPAVDGAGEHFVARRFVNRQRLAGDRRLVDGTVSGQHMPVQRNLVAGPHDNHHAGHDLLHAHPAIAGSVAHQRVGWCEIHQRPDGEARAIQRAGFERLGHREQEHHRGGLRPLAEPDGACGGNQHEDVDVDRAGANGCCGFACGQRGAGAE